MHYFPNFKDESINSFPKADVFFLSKIYAFNGR